MKKAIAANLSARVDPHLPRPLVVVQLVGSFSGGGAERVAWDLANSLESRGFESIAVALRDRGQFAEAEPNRLCIELGLTGDGAVARVRTMLRFRTLVKRRKVDIVHTHTGKAAFFAAAALAGMRRKPRLFLTWHDSLNLPTGKGQRLIRWAIRRCERVFVPSAGLEQRLATVLGPAVAFATISNGVRIRPKCTKSSSAFPTILWTARFHEKKDPLAALRAAIELRRRGLRFRMVLAGWNGPNSDQSFQRDLRSFITANKLEEAVFLVDWTDDTEELTTGAEIGLQTSHSEGLSLALLEHMMAGLAVVATDVGDTARAVENGRTGILISPGDDESLVEALALLLTNRDVRERLGNAARERALSRFTVAAASESVAEWYRSAA